MTTFNDFLNTNLEDFNVIFNFYLDFLGEFSSKKFPFEEEIKLKGAGNKFIHTVERVGYIQSQTKDDYMNLINSFLDESRYHRHDENRIGLYKFLFPNRPKRIMVNLQDSFQKLFSETLILINETTNRMSYFDELKLNDFYKPENSNKLKIKDLIQEAISIIEGDESLTEKSKKCIVAYLEKALKELDGKYVNWTKFIGRIKETIIVLGALGSLVGGASALYSAQDKLEQSTEIIQKTSVNINYTVLNETFNIQYIQNIGTINTLLALPEKFDIDSKIKNNNKLTDPN